VFVLATARYANGYPARFHVVPGWMVNADEDARRPPVPIGSLDVTADMLHIPYQIAEGEAHGHGPLEAGAGGWSPPTPWPATRRPSPPPAASPTPC
jgi:hypothetical protein